LAHELCHILYDRAYGLQLAVASGPWAPVEVERRANAFAAMFLMPHQVLQRAIAHLDQPLGSPDGVARIAEMTQTSFTSTLEHLCNLDYLDHDTRDYIRYEADKAAFPRTE
jgi:Zn-dependent peptidase ImmA (M78 family)